MPVRSSQDHGIADTYSVWPALQDQEHQDNVEDKSVGDAQPVTTTGSKLEKLPQPIFTLNMTESQWSFTKTQWDNYINQSTVSESVKLMQLQAACDDALRQRVFDTGTVCLSSKN